MHFTIIVGCQCKQDCCWVEVNLVTLTWGHYLILDIGVSLSFWLVVPAYTDMSRRGQTFLGTLCGGWSCRVCVPVGTHTHTARLIFCFLLAAVVCILCQQQWSEPYCNSGQCFLPTAVFGAFCQHQWSVLSANNCGRIFMPAAVVSTLSQFQWSVLFANSCVRCFLPTSVVSAFCQQLWSMLSVSISGQCFLSLPPGDGQQVRGVGPSPEACPVDDRSH